MTLDEQQLFARFREGFDTSSNQVLTLNKPSTIVDASKPWCRYFVDLGEKSGRQETGSDPFFQQLGGVFLQVFVPKKLGINAGDELLRKFDDLFCDWTSEDGAIQIGRMTRTKSETSEQFQVNVRFAFESMRKRT